MHDIERLHDGRREWQEVGQPVAARPEEQDRERPARHVLLRCDPPIDRDEEIEVAGHELEQVAGPTPCPAGLWNGSYHMAAQRCFQAAW